METACKKNKDLRTHNKNLITVYIKSSYPFYRSRLLHPVAHMKLSTEDLNSWLMIFISGRGFSLNL